MIRTATTTLLAGLLVSGCTSPSTTNVTSDLPDDLERVWIGSDFYANRLMDWRYANGRIECIEGRSAKPMRTLHLLTHYLGAEGGELSMSVQTGALSPTDSAHSNTWSGFLLGAGGPDVDWRISSLVHHWPAEDGGLIVGIDGHGQIMVRSNTNADAPKGPRANIPVEAWPLIEPETSTGNLPAGDPAKLSIHASQTGSNYELFVTASDPVTEEVLAEAQYIGLPDDYFEGNVALVSHNSPRMEGEGYWFDDWTIGGSKFLYDDARAFGPILAALYTVSDGTLKMTAQMPPIGENDTPMVGLELMLNGDWVPSASATILPGSYTAPLRVDDFEANTDVPYRLTYDLRTSNGNERVYFPGTVRMAQIEDDEFVLASLNCQNISRGRDLVWNHSTIWYPHNELTAAVAYHDPDLLFFAGDQIYEGGLAGIIRTPLDKTYLDYHYHWYRFLWAFRDLMRDRPTVTIPDDHDVYHGNIWGHGGKKAEGPWRPQSDNGGYIMDARFVNAVHETQVSHLPDPFDPTPIEQDISVYYTSLNYGDISFAIVADRMWKSAPRLVLPEAQVRNGWPENRDYDATSVTEAHLLGPRQLKFLNQWAHQFPDNVWMKVMLSQTLFSNLATLPSGSFDDRVVPQMRYAEPGEYISDDHKGTDMDSNGWPQSGRNRALAAIRKGFAFHVAGDQHLGSFVQYGIDEFGDGPNAFISPAIANVWPRRWFPPESGGNRKPGAPAYTGDHLDGFGNHMTVHAVANPVKSGRTPEALYDRVPGYGIVRFDRDSRTITAEAWPRWVDPGSEDAYQYSDWPVTVTQESNYGRRAAGYLTPINVEGLAEPVLTLIDETTTDTLYTRRLSTLPFRAKVFDTSSSYTAVVGDQSTREKRLTGLQVNTMENPETLVITF